MSSEKPICIFCKLPLQKYSNEDIYCTHRCKKCMSFCEINQHNPYSFISCWYQEKKYCAMWIHNRKKFVFHDYETNGHEVYIVMENIDFETTYLLPKNILGMIPDLLLLG